MSNLTIAVDEAVIKAARIRAIAEGTSVSARVRDYLAAYGNGQPGASTALVAAEPQPAGLAARRSVSGAANSPSVLKRAAVQSGHGLPAATKPHAPQPAWLATLRERVQAFGGAEPADWLPPRDTNPPRQRF